MTDSRFFKNKGPYSLQYIVDLTGCEVHNNPGNLSLSDIMINDIATLVSATERDISFLINHKYSDQYQSTKARACFVSKDMVAKAPANTICLVHKNHHKAYAMVTALFYKQESTKSSVHATAVLGDNVKIGNAVTISANAVIGDGAEIADGVFIGANTVIGDGVVIGKKSIIHANCTISHTMIGDAVTIFPGARIGQPGFGYAMDPTGHVHVEQLGRVLIGNFVEIGANTTIDRGAGPDTIIGDGTIIDNLVQIGHNVKTGRGCVIVSQTGISGSTVLGDFVVLAGQVGVSGHLKIGTGAKVGAKGGVMQDIPAGLEVGGHPAVPVRQFLKQSILLNRMTNSKKKTGDK